MIDPNQAANASPSGATPQEPGYGPVNTGPVNTGPVNTGQGNPGPSNTGPNSPGQTPPFQAYPPVPLPSAPPNPGLAALLGFIPGVGAMYNGQYVKGILHLIIFTVLISLTDVSGLFGLFIAGWEFYMAFDAHHTAKARLEGLPLPNPFGFNDIGERLGFGKNWPGGVDVAGAARDAAQAATQGFSRQPAPTPEQQAAWQASQQQYAQQYVNTVYEQAHRDAGTPPFTGQPYTPVNPYPTPEPPYPMPPMQTSPLVNTPLSRFPAGAAWLIGLGILFLLLTTGRFDAFAIHGFLGFVLIGLGVWTFIRRMTQTGQGIANDGSPLYTVRLVRALRGAFWLTCSASGSCWIASTSCRSIVAGPSS